MPILKCRASKATPAKGINYILDPEKVVISGRQNVASGDPQKMAKQMLQTMAVFGKGGDREERKYYHAKLSFDPADRPENGGKLTKEMAAAYARKFAAEKWPNREVVWAVQDHGTSIHIHFIVGACDLDTGKKLDARDATYREWKDYAQELAGEFGLSQMDWREATAKKRAGIERQPELPIEESFAEKGLQDRGATSWKEELRERIDRALKSSSSIDQFQSLLEADGVTLTRCTEQTISYKLGDHRACRGDTLGGDYTAAAIRSALQHNQDELVPEQGKAHPGIDALIGNAERRGVAAAAGVRVITAPERELFREFGRLAGVKRSEIDEMCDNAPKATWDEKKGVWVIFSESKNVFWAEYGVRDEAIKKNIDEAYKRLRRIKNAEWALDPRNRRKSLMGVIYALIVTSRDGSSIDIKNEIQVLKMAQQALREDMKAFRADSAAARETLLEKGLSLEAYMDTVRRLQEQSEDLARKNGLLLTPEERAKIEKTVAKKKAKAAAKVDRGGR